jgi:hypothetical protein
MGGTKEKKTPETVPLRSAAHGRRRGAKKSHPSNHLDRLAREHPLPPSPPPNYGVQ